MEKHLPLQLLLVSETSGEGKTDAIYINNVINKYFDVEGVNIQYIYLKGKQNYKDKKIREHIKNLTSMFGKFPKGKTVTIYFIDVDSEPKEFKAGSFFKNLCEYIEENNFELVWFCKNAENVFLNAEPENLENKTASAKDFAASNKIDSIDKDKLCKMAIELNCSNILVVLSKYLSYKK